jgi:hypothetical protein
LELLEELRALCLTSGKPCPERRYLRLERRYLRLERSNLGAQDLVLGFGLSHFYRCIDERFNERLVCRAKARDFKLVLGHVFAAPHCHIQNLPDDLPAEEYAEDVRLVLRSLDMNDCYALEWWMHGTPLPLRLVFTCAWLNMRPTPPRRQALPT